MTITDKGKQTPIDFLVGLSFSNHIFNSNNKEFDKHKHECHTSTEQLFSNPVYFHTQKTKGIHGNILMTWNTISAKPTYARTLKHLMGGLPEYC